MDDGNIDVCPCCGTIIESGQRVCHNCDELIADIDMDSY